MSLLALRLRAAAAACLLAAATASPPAFGQTTEPGFADRAGIEAALHRYTRGLDRLDADLYVSALTPDAEIVIAGDSFQGHEAMRRIIADEAELRRITPRTLFHMETNHSIELVAPDRAVHHAYWITIVRDGEGALDILDTGSSTDELSKTGGEWLIARREIRLEP